MAENEELEQRAVERLAEDERLRGELTDFGFEPLFKWATDAVSTFVNSHPVTEQEVDTYTNKIRDALSSVVQLASSGKLADPAAIEALDLPPEQKEALVSQVQAFKPGDDPDSNAEGLAAILQKSLQETVNQAQAQAANPPTTEAEAPAEQPSPAAPPETPPAPASETAAPETIPVPGSETRTPEVTATLASATVTPENEVSSALASATVTAEAETTPAPVSSVAVHEATAIQAIADVVKKNESSVAAPSDAPPAPDLAQKADQPNQPEVLSDTSSARSTEPVVAEASPPVEPEPVTPAGLNKLIGSVKNFLLGKSTDEAEAAKAEDKQEAEK